MTKLQLRPPKHRVERRAIALWVIQALILGAVLFAISVTSYILWEQLRWLSLLVIILVGVLVFIRAIIEPLLRYKIHRWEVTNEAVYGLSGWFVREWRVAPISRIQTVDAVRGPIEQLLGLSTLRITTASSKGAIVIVGLDKDVAAQAAQELTEITEKTPGDAT